MIENTKEFYKNSIKPAQSKIVLCPCTKLLKDTRWCSICIFKVFPDEPGKTQCLIEKDINGENNERK